MLDILPLQRDPAAAGRILDIQIIWTLKTDSVIYKRPANSGEEAIKINF